MKFEKQVSLKWAIALVLIACLVSSSIVYYVFAVSPSSTFTISSGIYPGAPSYTIWREGGYYFAKDANGEIDYSGMDANTVIQAGLNGLTSGRTWQEKVVLKGDYSLTNSLTLPSYTILDLSDAKLTLANGVNKYCITSTNSTDIAVIGGIINGNKAGQTLAAHGTEGIYFDSVSNSTIRDVYIYDTKWVGIGWTGAPNLNNKILHNHIKSSDSDGIFVGGFRDSLISGNILETVGDVGIVVGNNCWDNIVENNIVISPASMGIAVTGTTVFPYNTILSGNYVYGGNRGFRIYAGVTKTILVGNIAHSQAEHGFFIDASSTILDGNIARNCTTYHGFTIYGVDGVVSDVSLVNNQAYDNIGHGIYLYNAQHCLIQGNRLKGNNYGIAGDGTSNYNTFIGNDLTGNSVPYSSVGSNNLVKNNMGFVTENSGTATITASTTVTFDHWLAGIPTSVECGFKTTGYGSWIWSATSIQITITVATSGTYTFSWYAEYKP